MTRTRTTPTAFKRFECVDPDRNHNKFYELSAEILLFGPTVTRRWGRIGFQETQEPLKGLRDLGADKKGN